MAEGSATEQVLSAARLARVAARKLAVLPVGVRNRALSAMAGALVESTPRLLEENARDVEAAQGEGLTPSLIDRLRITPERIASMASSLEYVARLEDPLGQLPGGSRRPNGLEITRVRVPLGVVGIIYEARPDVTVDAAGLCVKSGNAVLLRGGSEALRTNVALAETIVPAAVSAGLPEHAIQVVKTADREAARAMMHARGHIDLLIPRGGAGLIRSVTEDARVPVIETGIGNCHLYLDASAPYDVAERITLNAKVQRPSVCNAIETLLVHRAFAEDGRLRRLADRLAEHGVELRGCARTRQFVPYAKEATEQDWATEYLALILAVKVVDEVGEAIDHIGRYGSSHSEAIVTQDLAAARRFTREIDSAVVYVNASTRFTDGAEFGLGAEVGISTQKLHARGPMGLEALTTTRYVVFGDGQVRG